MAISKKKLNEMSDYICEIFGVSTESEKASKKGELANVFESYGIAPAKDKLDYIPDGQLSLEDIDIGGFTL